MEVPIEPPSATTTTTIGILATSPTFTSAFGKKRANLTTMASTSRKTKKNKLKDSPSEPIILQDPQVALAPQKADKNKINGEPRGGGVPGGNSDSDNLDSADCNSESSSGSKSQELSDGPSSSSSSSTSSSSFSAPLGPAKKQPLPEKHQGLSLQTSREEKLTPTKPQHK